MKATVRLTGFEGLDRRLAELPRRVSRRVQFAALRAGAEPMRADMQRRASPRGRRFAEPIAVQPVRAFREAGMPATVAVGPTRAFFYGFEFGTSRQAARPFARPAFDAQVMRSLELVRQHLWSAIRREAPDTFGPRAFTGGGIL